MTQTNARQHTVVIVEDNVPTKERMEQAINKSDRFTLVGSSTTVKGGQALLAEHTPDILLTDLDLPDGNGTELIEMVNQPEQDNQLAIVISVFGDEQRVIKAIQAGASGYLLKDDPFFEIEEALDLMLKGGSPISPNIARYVLNAFNKINSEPSEAVSSNKIETLSDRENEVLILTSKGLTAKEISSHLNISHHTVSSHIKKIYRKLSVNNKTEAIQEAQNHGLI